MSYKNTNGTPEITDQNDYYPFGMNIPREEKSIIGTASLYNYKYNGKELQETGMYDYGARSYMPDVGRWMSPDPLSEQYRRWSPYNYTVNNPIRFTDPDGRSVKDIIGATKQDAQKFKADVHKVLSDSKFAGVRALIDVKGKSFNKIDSKALATATSGLSKDEQAYVNTLAGAINSSKVHKVEYLSIGDTASSEGTKAFVGHIDSKVSAGLGNSFLTPAGDLNASTINGIGGEGLNVATSNGSHSFIIETASTTADSRAETSSHEVLGHGIPSSKGASDAVNNTNAIQMSNLVRRVTGSPEPPRDGTNPPHAGGKVTNPNDLPMNQ